MTRNGTGAKPPAAAAPAATTGDKENQNRQVDKMQSVVANANTSAGTAAPAAVVNQYKSGIPQATALTAAANNNNGGAGLSDEVLQHRTVIDIDLLIKAVKDDRMQHIDTVGNAPDYDEAVDLQAVKSLTLSFKNIYQIDNLQGFEQCLTKLQLDNNIIQRIENLSHLTNLRWLDLSFNNIKVIEGLDQLVNLTDLSLFNNDIEVIENLDNLVNLNVLSLGNNNIKDVNQLKRLRQFKNLRLLNLKGNPVYDLDDYQPTIFAYLTSLKYLDYELIESDQFRKARDAKLDQIVELEDIERLSAASQAEEEISEVILQLAKEANLQGLSTLFSDILAADTEQSKLSLLPNFQHVLDEYGTMFATLRKEFSSTILQRHQQKLKETALFDDVLAKIREDHERVSVELIQDFSSKKKKSYAAYSLSVQQGQRNVGILAELKQEVIVLNDNLMEMEMELAGQTNEVINQFDTTYSALVTLNLNTIASNFRALTDVANSYADTVGECVHESLDVYHQQENAGMHGGMGSPTPQASAGLSSAMSSAGGGRRGSGSNGGKGSSVFAVKTGGTATATIDDDDNEDGDEAGGGLATGNGSSNSINSMVGLDEDGNLLDKVAVEGFSTDLLMLLQDKDVINGAVSTSHDNHLAKILAKEDEIRDREDLTAKQKLKVIRKAEYTRNRQRVHEITKFTQREVKLLTNKAEVVVAPESDDEDL
jgi:hypothetical protein